MGNNVDILLIEDDSMHAVLIRRACERYKGAYNIRVADCLVKARTMIEEHEPAIVLVDWLLPDGKGIDFLQEYNESNFPIIVLTSHGSERIAVDALKAGAFDYLSKSAEMFADMPHIIERTLRQWQHILEKREAELALRKSEEKFRRIFENIEDVYFEIDLQGRILEIAPSVSGIVNSDPEKLKGQPFKNFFDIEEDYQDLMYGLQGKSKISGFDTRFIGSDDTRIMVSISAFCCENRDNGEEKIIVGAFKNITGHRMMMRALRESEERFRGIFEHSYDGISIIDNTGKIVGWNQALSKILDVKTDKILGRYYWDFMYEKFERMFEGESDYNQLRELYLKAIDSGDVDYVNQIQEFSFLKGDNQLRHVDVVMFTIPSSQGNYLCGIYRDITETKSVEQELIHAKERAEEGSQLKTTILANLSHELRTPLTGILGFSQMLHKTLEDEDEREMTDMIIKSGDRLLRTINSILALSELEANKINLNLEDIHLSSLVKTVLFSFEDMCQEKDIYLKIDIKDENIYATMDEYFLNQILFNLIDNAVKFTFEGGVTIELGSYEVNDDTEAYIKVIDTGLGIAQENLKYIYNEFRQGSEGRDRSYEGVGLGLTLTYKMVGLMNGDIEIESEVDKGTSFMLKFPGKKESGNYYS